MAKYEEWLKIEKLTILEGWARDGLTDAQIAHNIGINVKTLYDWKKKHSNICNALKKGKEVVDIEVENALLKKAKGYRTKEIISERVLNPSSGEYELVVTKVIDKEVHPDTTAQIFWLKNRKPDKWRDKPEVVINEIYEDDGLLAALDKQIEEDIEDDSWMVEEEGE